jgi:hypothetical protein
MKTSIGMAVFIIAGMSACAPRQQTPDELVLLDETVPLARQRTLDVAARELTVDSDGFVVAIVDENLTDVRVKLGPVEVENNQSGAGIEIAATEAKQDSRVTLTLESHQDATRPGQVHVRVLRLRRGGGDDARYAARLAGYRAWTEGTRSGLRATAFESTGLPALERAIASFAEPAGDPRLHAYAQVLKAHGLRFFQIDFSGSRAAAQAAQQSFATLATPDPLGAARARFTEARALVGMSTQRASQTSAEGAEGLARGLR